MSIRPVDMKNLMPKIQQMSRIQQMENDKQKSFVYFQNNNQAKKIEKELKQVRNSEKTSKSKITKDSLKKENSTKQNGNNEDSNANILEEKSAEKENISNVLGLTIDIKI